MKIRFEITPQPKQSAQFYNRGGKICSFQPKEKIEYKNFLRWQAIDFNKSEHFYTDKPIIVKNLVFSFPWLSTARKKDRERGYAPKSTKPDIDNLMKALWDAIEGVFFVNDSQIYKIENLEKRYSDHGYIELEMREATDSEVSLIDELAEANYKLELVCEYLKHKNFVPEKIDIDGHIPDEFGLSNKDWEDLRKIFLNFGLGVIE